MDTDFPYDAVVTEFQRVGKHFVRPAILAALAAERETASPELATFLDFTLDKYDGRYDNPSYIAVDLLPLGGTRAELDRLVAILVADVLRHELTHGDDERLVAKRCRLGLRVLGRGDDPLAACAAVEREFDDAEAERVRRLTVLPVSLVHDEYMFIRMLQCYEATFAFIAVKLREAIDAPETAAEAIGTAEQAMLAARPLWSMVATMRAAALPGVPRVHRRRQRDPVAQLQARREPVCAAFGGAARLTGLPVRAGSARTRAGRPAFARRRRA